MEGQIMTVSEAKHAVQLNEWKQMIRRCQESGLTVREWCAQNGVYPQTYYRRLRRVREAVLEQNNLEPITTHEQMVPTLVKVNTKPEPQHLAIAPEPPVSTNFRLHCNGSVLDIPVGTCSEAIAEVLKAMGQYAF